MVTHPRNAFGVWLHEQLVEANMNTRDLADAIGITRESVSNHLNGRFAPNRHSLRQYANYFGVNYWELYEMTVSGQVHE